MGHEQNRAPFASYLAHFPEAFLLEVCVTDREHFVHKKDLRFEVCGNSEREAYVHAARITLHGRVDEFFHLCKSNDLIELTRDFRSPHAQNSTIQIDVVAPGQFGMEAGPDLQKRADASPDVGISVGRISDP